MTFIQALKYTKLPFFTSYTYNNQEGGGKYWYIELHLIGTEFNAEVSQLGILWTEPVEYNDFELDMPITFEEVFEQIPDNIKEYFLFHLDLFQ